ncbi:MAG: DUF86 domain-containing protein [Deltaproteobacteria bacterium]|nr:DUF86 domain-containing protein [Deltaproteobacteria bacterium]
MNQRDIQTKLDVIIDNLDKLNILKDKTFEEFTSDFRNIDSTLHRLQTSIQALLDIGSYIIASLGLKTPNTNAEIIEILNEGGYLPKDKAKTYIKISQFRNRIVHLYNHIDTETLYDVLINELKDIIAFYIDLIKIIENHRS